MVGGGFCSHKTVDWNDCHFSGASPVGLNGQVKCEMWPAGTLLRLQSVFIDVVSIPSLDSDHCNGNNTVVNPIHKPIASLTQFYLVAVWRIKEGGRGYARLTVQAFSQLLFKPTLDGGIQLFPFFLGRLKESQSATRVRQRYLSDSSLGRERFPAP